jgi:hypothetical protein
MKKALGFLAAGGVLVGIYLLLGPVLAQVGLGNIFVRSDTDAFDPGLPIGAQFPSIRALYRGKEITGIDQFMGEKGVVFFANRSVDW